MLSCSGVMRHTWKLGHQRVSTVCVRSTPGTTCMSCAYKHGETVTHCMLSFSRLSCLPGKTARCLSLCLCLSSHPSLLLCLRTAVWSFHNRIFSFMETACQFLQPPPPSFRYHHGFFSVWCYHDRRAEPAASCLTGKSQAELANDQTQLRRCRTAGMYHPLWFHSEFSPDPLMKMSHPQIVLLWIGGKLVVSERVRVQLARDPAQCQAGCKPI